MSRVARPRMRAQGDSTQCTSMSLLVLSLQEVQVALRHGTLTVLCRLGSLLSCHASPQKARYILAALTLLMQWPDTSLSLLSQCRPSQNSTNQAQCDHAIRILTPENQSSSHSLSQAQKRLGEYGSSSCALQGHRCGWMQLPMHKWGTLPAPIRWCQGAALRSGQPCL